MHEIGYSTKIWPPKGVLQTHLCRYDTNLSSLQQVEGDMLSEVLYCCQSRPLACLHGSPHAASVFANHLLLDMLLDCIRCAQDAMLPDCLGSAEHVSELQQQCFIMNLAVGSCAGVVRRLGGV